MKLFTLPNLVSHSVVESDDLTLSTVKNSRPLGMTKEQFRSWCIQAATNGNFLSVWEGLNPFARINTGNPPKRLHGIIADYDSANAASKIQSLPNSTGHLPTWVIESFSPGKVRLVWAFEKPVNVSNPYVTEGFLKELDKKIKISDALPGFDKASWKDTQYFELGSQWHTVAGATPIPVGVLGQCVMEGGLSAKVQVDDSPLIPMEVIAAEVEARFPGRWQGPFEEGARGPLFWINDGIDRIGCAVAENGMICYSDRAGSNFMPWWAIFGRKFVDNYETEKASKAAEMFYFDGTRYWTNYASSNWNDLQKEDAKVHLRNAGCTDKIRKGKGVSEVDQVIIHVQNNRRVAAAVPMLFMADEVVPYNGREYLNISTKKAMAPAETGDPKDFPWIYNFVMNGFDGDMNGIPAYEFFLGWLRRFWMTSHQGNPQPGQAIILAGEAHTGKTFISKWIIGASVGGSVSAEQYLMQRTAFNAELATNALWRCDDAISEGDFKTKQIFANSLKAIAANPTVLYQPKFKDTTELPFKGRVFVTCNVDPESLKILPFLDGTIKDKLCLFRISPKFTPHFFSNNRDNEERALRELPHFLRWLMDRPVPPEVIDTKNPRFEIRSFHHRHLVEEANSEQRESILAEVIHGVMSSKRGSVPKGESVKLSVTELIQEATVLGYDKTLQQLGGVVYIGKMLTKVIEQKLSPHLTVPATKSKGLTRYKFDPWAEPQEGAE